MFNRHRVLKAQAVRVACSPHLKRLFDLKSLVQGAVIKTSVPVASGKNAGATFLESIMSYVRATGRVTRSLCYFLFSIAVFLLWALLAAGAGFILLHLPDVWASHSNDENARFAVMSVTTYAVIVGALFLIFVAGAAERLSDAAIAARTALRHIRKMRTVRRTRRDHVSAVALHPVRNTH
jgi:hypothetical protein